MANRLMNPKRDQQTIRIKECADPSTITREQEKNVQTMA
jgi:hypothetical protein